MALALTILVEAVVPNSVPPVNTENSVPSDAKPSISNARRLHAIVQFAVVALSRNRCTIENVIEVSNFAGLNT
jgi:hypothetical protein